MERHSLMSVVLCLWITSALACHGAGSNPTGAYAQPSALAALLADGAKKANVDYIVVDVRTAEEYAEGHLPKAVNIPHGRIAQDLKAPDLGTPVILYCKKGIRSSRATEALREKGFTNLTNFGGIGRWQGHIER